MLINSLTDGLYRLFAKDKLTPKERALELVNTDGHNIIKVSPRFLSDKEVALRAVSSTGWALEFFTPELRNDFDIVLAAVSHYGSAFQYASPELRSNKVIALSALLEHRHPGITSRHYIVDFIDDILFYDIEIAIAVFEISPSYFNKIKMHFNIGYPYDLNKDGRRILQERLEAKILYDNYKLSPLMKHHLSK